MGSACLPSMVLGCYHNVLDLCKDDVYFVALFDPTLTQLFLPVHMLGSLRQSQTDLCPGQRGNRMLMWKIPIMLLDFVAIGTGAAHCEGCPEFYL